MEKKFTLITDHKPLTAILGPKKGIPSLAAARLQRWALLLTAYDYNICYKPTEWHSNTDGLSRLPLPSQDTSLTTEVASVFHIGLIQTLPVTFQQVQSATRCDPTLSKIATYAQSGWPGHVSDDLKPYHSRRDEVRMENGCLMLGVHVIIPNKLQDRILQSLHENHPGITRMKAVARMKGLCIHWCS